MNADRAVVSNEGMTQTYWPMAVIDEVFKQNLQEKSTTGHIPFQQWNDNTVRIPPLHVSGQIGRVPNLPITVKLQSRGQMDRYVDIKSQRYIRVEHSDGRIDKVRTKSFHPIHKK